MVIVLYAFRYKKISRNVQLLLHRLLHKYRNIKRLVYCQYGQCSLYSLYEGPTLETLDYSYYPYRQYTDLFIFRFVSLLCLALSTMLLLNCSVIAARPWGNHVKNSDHGSSINASPRPPPPPSPPTHPASTSCLQALHGVKNDDDVVTKTPTFCISSEDGPRPNRAKATQTLNNFKKSIHIDFFQYQQPFFSCHFINAKPMHEQRMYDPPALHIPQRKV